MRFIGVLHRNPFIKEAFNELSPQLYQVSLRRRPGWQFGPDSIAVVCTVCDAAQCVIRPHPGVVCGIQPGLCQILEGQDRPGRDHQAKPRRLGQAGALHHRRAGSRRGHPGPGGRHRCAAHQWWVDPQRLAKAPAAQQLALQLHHRAGGAPGQPQGHQGLGRPGAPRCEGDHPQPQNIGWRALELPGRLGICQAQIWR